MFNRSVNRSVLVIRAKEPFREWILSLPEPPVNLTLEEINDDNTVYLIPEYDEDKDREKLLRKKYIEIFSELLEDWCLDEAFWPKSRTFATFKKWFDVEFHSLVIDLVGKEIIHEEE
ncbi:MAG: hypothetical protein ACOYL3_06445 [Desulfuromonadaceae bacterium]